MIAPDAQTAAADATEVPPLTAHQDATVADPPKGGDGNDPAPDGGKGSEKGDAAADAGIVLAPLRLSVPSKAIGVCWFLLAYLFLSQGMLANCLLVSCVGTWCGWEVYWRRIWRKQEEEATKLVEQLAATCQADQEGQTVDQEALRRLHLLSWEICKSTTQTPMRCVVESLVVMCCLYVPLLALLQPLLSLLDPSTSTIHHGSK